MLFLFQKQVKNVYLQLQLFYIFENIKVIKGDSFVVISQQTTETNSVWCYQKLSKKCYAFQSFLNKRLKL